MDSSRIKKLATGVREALRNEVSARLESVLAEGSRERLESPSQVSMIEKSIGSHGRDEVVDRAAYTWFNRLCALRFMDANGYTPTPVVTPRPGSTQPAVLADAAQGLFDPEYGVSQDARQRVTGLLTGAIPSDNAVEGAYSILLREVCQRYAEPMGYLFSEDVASSLLMPQGLLAQGSILSRIVSEMDEEACSDVEVLGWLYQFYIEERRVAIFADYKKGKKAKRSDIPAATQLFTPEWIVRYLADNSLGRLWMLNNSDSDLVDQMDYYVALVGDEPHVTVSSADEIRVLDPACGSGHILVYAFDLLIRMYEEEGWPTEDIPEMILQNNLFGLEVDRRAAEIASFALEMKARERDPHFFDKDVDANIYVLEPVELLPQELELVPRLAERPGLLEVMAHLDEVGSLYDPDSSDKLVLMDELEHIRHDGSLFAESALSKLRVMLSNVNALSRRFHCVIANPPYMGSRNMNPFLVGWTKSNYPNERGDFCTCFINRGLHFVSNEGYLSIITSDTCLSLPTFESMRVDLISHSSVIGLIDTHGINAHPDVFDANAGWVIEKGITGLEGTFFKLNQALGTKSAALREAVAGRKPEIVFHAGRDLFENIPGWRLTAYWAGNGLRRAFAEGTQLGNIVDAKQGLATADNDRFLRLWWETSREKCCYVAQSLVDAQNSRKKWFPYNKGGTFRKWYGNLDYLVNWEDDGVEIRNSRDDAGKQRSAVRNPEYYFRESVTWTDITSSGTHFRYRPAGSLYDVKGMSCFPSRDQMPAILALCNSSTVSAIQRILSRTMSTQIGEVSQIPILKEAFSNDAIRNMVEDNISITRVDWDAFETSWDFICHPLIQNNAEGSKRIVETYAQWASECQDRFNRLKVNEEELNRIFARIYHMEGEVPIEVPDDKVSVRLADRDRDARSLISYGIGCMFGRYSTEVEGLVLADQGSTLDDFRANVLDAKYLPDEDNVLPVLSDEWFDDDIVSGFRTWLAYAFGLQTVDENVAWLEESIGKDLRTYFCKNFYPDHLKTYHKRPIYWMFQSPRKTFQCLVYMHRYDEGTVGTILTGYLRPLEEKLRSRTQMLDSPGASAREMKERDRLLSQIAELEQWEREVIYPLAHERVSIDLDDGVKVNYNKFPKALAKVTGLSEWR